MKGNRFDYNLGSELATAKEPYTVFYDEFTIKGNSGTFDNKNGMFKSNKADITSKSGDKFTADKADGNLHEMRMDFIGNAKGHTNYDGKRTDFSGDFARVYFKKDVDGYKAIRSEIKKNAVFIQEDKTLKSDYIEADIERNLVFARDNTKMIVKDKDNGDIIITSDVAEINMNNDTATLIGDVYIENINKEQGKTVITADKGIDRQTGILDLIGNVKIENAESIVESDEAIYNMNTKKLKAKGHVYINHKNQ